jgi:hypothetical protein
MPFRGPARNIPKDLHGAVSYTKITDVADAPPQKRKVRWYLRRHRDGNDGSRQQSEAAINKPITLARLI